jgi:hypothetical protein
MKRFLAVAIVASAMAAMVLTPTTTFGVVIVDDSWADGGRNNGADLLDADWWSSVASNNTSVEVGSGYMGLVTGTAGRGLHGTFAPQTLAIGDTLTATLTFLTPATVGSESGGGGFRFVLADFNNAGLAADLQSSTSFVQPLFTNLPAYMVDFDVNRPGVADDTSVRKHNPNSTGRLAGTTAEWTQLGTSTDVDYSFTPNTEYVVVLSLTRTGLDSMDVFGSLSSSNVLLTSHTQSDASGIVNNIGLVGVFANSGLFGSSPTIGAADNGIDFTNIRIEVIPEPSTLVLAFVGLAGLLYTNRRRR